jgi:hypothetical protein
MEGGEHENGAMGRSVALLNKGNLGMSRWLYGLPRQTLICPMQAPTVTMREDGSSREKESDPFLSMKGRALLLRRCPESGDG